MNSLEYKKKLSDMNFICMERMLEVASNHLKEFEQLIPSEEDKDQHALMAAELREKIAGMDVSLKTARMAKKRTDSL